MEFFQYQIEKCMATPSGNQAYWERSVRKNEALSKEQKSKWASPTEGAHFWQKISTVQVEYDGNDELRLLPGRKDAINSIVASIDHAKEEQERQQRLQS